MSTMINQLNERGRKENTKNSIRESDMAIEGLEEIEYAIWKRDKARLGERKMEEQQQRRQLKMEA